MVFDPFAPESLKQPSQGAPERPSFGEAVRSKAKIFATQAGAVMGFAGSLVAFEQAHTQEVAVATPQGKPSIAGPAVPGNTETTTEEIPTAEAIIEILRNGKENIRRKFPNYNDAAFQQIVGQISLGTVKAETLLALGTAFEEGSPEKKAIIIFSKTVGAPKPVPTLPSPPDVGGKKLPPLNETPSQKKERKETERREGILKDTLNTLNKGGFFDEKSWSSDASKGAKAKMKHSRNSITVEFDQKTVDGKNASPRSTAFMRVTLLPGKTYKINFGRVSEGAVVQIKENQNGKFTTLAAGLKVGPNIFQIPKGHEGTIELEIVNSPMNPITTIEGASITEVTEEEKLVGN